MNKGIACLAVLISVTCAGCATIYNVHPPDEDHADSLRVAQVFRFFTREIAMKRPAT